MIFVTEMFSGSRMSDDFNTKILYVGTDFELAKMTGINYQEEDTYEIGCYIQYWENGKLVKQDLIRRDKYNKYESNGIKDRELD
jgi:hypothetical protein